MKKPDAFRENLIACMDEAIDVAENGDAHDLLDFAHHAHARMSETLTYIQQLESSYSQVSKALCGKENATLDELLQAVDQVKQAKPGTKLICEITVDGEDIRKALEEVELDGKTLAEWMELAKGYEQLKAELATVKQERDAAVKGLTMGSLCSACKKYFKNGDENSGCAGALFYIPYCFEWQGVCPENTEVQGDD